MAFIDPSTTDRTPRAKNREGDYPETDPTFFRTRGYSTVLSRFMQEDPIGYVDSPNLYETDGDSPACHVDPMGLFHWTVDGSGNAIAGSNDTLWGLANVLTGDGKNWKQFAYTGDPNNMQQGTTVNIKSFLDKMIGSITAYNLALSAAKHYADMILKYCDKNDPQAKALLGGTDAASWGVGLVSLGAELLTAENTVVRDYYVPKVKALGVGLTAVGFGLDILAVYKASKNGDSAALLEAFGTSGIDILALFGGPVGAGVALAGTTAGMAGQAYYTSQTNKSNDQSRCDLCEVAKMNFSKFRDKALSLKAAALSAVNVLGKFTTQ